MALWGGRFEKGVDAFTQEFGASLEVDKAMAQQDIAGSRAHAKMLAEQGIISEADQQAIDAGLADISGQIVNGDFAWDVNDEDIHMAVEGALTRNIGTPGARLHTGRSRNDQVATDIRLYAKELCSHLMEGNRSLRRVFLDVAEKNMGVVMPGYTHLQKAQPVLLSHHLLAYWEMLDRDEARLRDCAKRVDVLPLGAAALAGTGLPIDRRQVAALLNFPAVSANSMDAVSDRDFVTEFIFAAALIMMHLSRFCEDLILWSSSEFGFVEISDAFTTGSSIMPQKKNPDVAELIRGKTGRVYGHLMSLLTLLKGLPMTYNRDLQEDKEPFFDADTTVSLSLEVMAGMLESLVFVPENMKAALQREEPLDLVCTCVSGGRPDHALGVFGVMAESAEPIATSEGQ